MKQSKSNLIFSEIIFKHNTMFMSNTDLQSIAIDNPEVFNIERLVELTMAEVGGYNYIDGAHCDFDDGSECKTASVRPSTKGSSNSYQLEISNVVSTGGNSKSGAIRVVLYNPHTYKLKYYYLPENTIHNIGVNYHSTTNSGRIFATWNRITDKCNKLDKFEVDSFETLAKMKYQKTTGVS